MPASSPQILFLPERIAWQVRRLKLMQEVPGFWAHWDTYVSADCVFAGNNHLFMKTWLYRVTMGSYSYIAGARAGFTTIGSFCSIGPEALIGGLGMHPTNFLTTHPAFFSTKKQAGVSFVRSNAVKELSQTHIGHDVWIGARALILDGVKIGNGAIIAANAVVTKHVPAYAVMAGIPARQIKSRFKKGVADCLEQWQWWNYPERVLKELAPEFTKKTDWTVADIKRLISKASEIE